MISADSTVAAIAGYAPGIIAKATALLAVCAGIAAVARRSSAAKQHLLWLCALVSCAALVVFAPISKRIVVPVPSFVPAHESSAGTTGIGNQVSNLARRHASQSPAQGVAVGRQAQSWNPAPPYIAPWRPSRVATVGLIVWLTGFLFVTLRFLFAYGSVNAKVRRSRELTGLRWRRALARATDRRDITLSVGDEPWSPFTVGVIRPTIILPADVDEWSDERRDAVLRHEIAHIERGDVATQTIGLLVCAVFWFHPLAWFALARLRYESERAADDRVISAGISSVAYAAHLVELARGVGNCHRVPPFAVAVATPPLEQRVRAILDRTRPRGAVATRARLAGMCTALAAMLPISAVEFTHAVRPQASAPVHHAVDRVAAAPVSLPRHVTFRPVKSQNAQPSSARRDTVVVAVADSLPHDSVEAATLARPGRVGLHPDFSGVWSWAAEPSAGGDTSAIPPTLTITQTPTTITETVQRRAFDEFGRAKGRLDATLQLEDGHPAHGAFALNGIPGHSTFFAMSWDNDTLMVRTAQMGRGSISGAVERLWLTSDGRGLVTHTAPFGYAVNQERTDTIWRQASRIVPPVMPTRP
jgi:beta-lactamase regulating signal transducer with metallopeptidase domain